MKIMNFNQFINESYSQFNELPKAVKDFFINGAQKNILSKVIGLRNFSITLEGDRIYFTINGRKILFPFVNYIGGEVVPNTNNLKDLTLIENFYKDLGLNYSTGMYHQDIKKRIEIEEGNYTPIEDVDYRIMSSGEKLHFTTRGVDENLGWIIYIIFDSLRKVVKEDIPVLNPFSDLDLNNNPLIKILEKLGAYVDTSEARRKKGILRFSIKDFNYGLIIQPNGYIRRELGHKTPILSSNMEISEPMYTEEDLNLKLSYLISYLMKDLLVYKFNVPVKDANKLCKSYVSGDLDSYSNLLLQIASTNPQIVVMMPDPNDVLDPEVKKGASMLSRFGLF
jgi:hypothetical protein